MHVHCSSLRLVISMSKQVLRKIMVPAYGWFHMQWGEFRSEGEEIFNATTSRPDTAIFDWPAICRMFGMPR